MGTRDWFRYQIDFSKEPIALTVMEVFGTKGFGHLVLFIEEVISQIKDDDAPIKAVLSIYRWAATLRMKQKGVRTFFDHLQDEGFLTYTENRNILTISIPKLSEILDLSWETRGRKSKKVPRRKEIKLNQTKSEDMSVTQIENKDTHEVSSFFDRVRKVLSSKNENKVEEIETLFRSFVYTYGANDSLLEKFEKMINARFTKSDCAKEYGKDFILSARTGYNDGIKQFGYSAKIMKRKKKKPTAVEFDDDDDDDEITETASQKHQQRVH